MIKEYFQPIELFFNLKNNPSHFQKVEMMIFSPKSLYIYTL